MTTDHQILQNPRLVGYPIDRPNTSIVISTKTGLQWLVFNLTGLLLAYTHTHVKLVHITRTVPTYDPRVHLKDAQGDHAQEPCMYAHQFQQNRVSTKIGLKQEHLTQISTDNGLYLI